MADAGIPFLEGLLEDEAVTLHQVYRSALGRP